MKRFITTRSGSVFPLLIALALLLFADSVATSTAERLLMNVRALPGQIVIDPEHPQWLMREGGKHVFICGPGDPEDFLYLGKRNPDGTRAGDQVARINKLAKHGGNSIYMHVVRTHGGDAKTDHTQNPFVDSDPAKGLDEDILKQWEEWFTLMDRHDILTYLFFYDDGARIWDTGDRVGPEEKVFVETITKKFKHHKNLIWIVGEESEEAYTTARVQAIAEIIRNADDHGHIIGAHHLSGTTFKAWQPGGALSHFSMQLAKTGDEAHAGAIEALQKAAGKYQIIYSESTAQRTDVEGMRRHAWSVAMAGLMPMLLRMDIANTPVEALKQCRHLQKFFEATDFWTMTSHDELKHDGTKYVLADPGRSYIAYADGPASRLGIRGLPAGRYAVTWLDCQTGATASGEAQVDQPGDHAFDKPRQIGAERAAWIRRVALAQAEAKSARKEQAGPKAAPTANRAPVVKDSMGATSPGNEVYIQLAFEDEDGPGPYSYTIVRPPAHGTLSGDNNDRAYMPKAGFTGTDQFTWKVNDGQADSETATATIEVSTRKEGRKEGGKEEIAQEPDKRLHSDGGGWRHEQAAVADPQRPRVLLIGSSILNGYRQHARALLDGKAYVDTWTTPLHHASGGLHEQLAGVLAAGPYEVILFNLGHGWQKGRIPEGQYEPLTRKLVATLRAHAPKASLIWAASTPITVKNKPGELHPEIDPVIVEQNRLAARALRELNVPVVDYYAVLLPHLDLARGDQFHWQPEAYQLLAQAGADAVVRELNSRASPLNETITKKFKQGETVLIEDPLQGQAKGKQAGAASPAATMDAPRVIREDIEWLNMWLPGNSVTGLPRVLLIGDSITQGYYQEVADRLKGRAVVARLTTSKSAGDDGLLAEVKLVLAQNRFDVVHFNNGLHGWGYTEQQYAKGLPDLVEAIRQGAPGARLVWAVTTPMRLSDNSDQDALRTERGKRVKARNKIAAEVMTRQKVSINDLYTLAEDKPEWYSRDGTHFNDQGKAALGGQVADHLLRALKEIVYFPPPDSAGGWRTLRDADEIHHVAGRVAGMDKKKLDEAFEFIKGSTKNGGLLVLRKGWLVYENYFGLGHREATPNLASCGKSFTSIAVGMLMAEQPKLFPDGLDQRVFTPAYFPAEAFPLSDPRKKDIKLGQLLAFTAGIRGNNPSYVKGKETTIDPVGPDGWQAGVDAIAMGKQDGVFDNKTPFSAATLWRNPGEGYSYASSSIHLASIMLRHVTGMELQEYVDKHLAKPLGWGRWGYGYKHAPEVTHTPGGGGIALRATDMLRFGYLLLREGRWNDEQLVPAEYIRLCARQSPYNPHYPYSLQFNVNTNGDLPELPRDAFWKSGSGGHALYVVPSLDLVVWKLGGRDEQYSPGNTGLPLSPAPQEQVAERKGWKETVDKETAIRKTLQLVIAGIKE